MNSIPQLVPLKDVCYPPYNLFFTQICARVGRKMGLLLGMQILLSLAGSRMRNPAMAWSLKKGGVRSPTSN